MGWHRVQFQAEPGVTGLVSPERSPVWRPICAPHRSMWYMSRSA